MIYNLLLPAILMVVPACMSAPLSSETARDASMKDPQPSADELRDFETFVAYETNRYWDVSARFCDTNWIRDAHNYAGVITPPFSDQPVKFGWERERIGVARPEDNNLLAYYRPADFDSNPAYAGIDRNTESGRLSLQRIITSNGGYDAVMTTLAPISQNNPIPNFLPSQLKAADEKSRWELSDAIFAPHFSALNSRLIFVGETILGEHRTQVSPQFGIWQIHVSFVVPKNVAVSAQEKLAKFFLIANAFLTLRRYVQRAHTAHLWGGFPYMTFEDAKGLFDPTQRDDKDWKGLSLAFRRDIYKDRDCNKEGERVGFEIRYAQGSYRDAREIAFVITRFLKNPDAPLKFYFPTRADDTHSAGTRCYTLNDVKEPPVLNESVYDNLPEDVRTYFDTLTSLVPQSSLQSQSEFRKFRWAMPWMQWQNVGIFSDEEQALIESARTKYLDILKVIMTYPVETRPAYWSNNNELAAALDTALASWASEIPWQAF